MSQMVTTKRVPCDDGTMEMVNENGIVDSSRVSGRCDVVIAKRRKCNLREDHREHSSLVEVAETVWLRVSQENRCLIFCVANTVTLTTAALITWLQQMLRLVCWTGM
jgi:hypothetical protein